MTIGARDLVSNPVYVVYQCTCPSRYRLLADRRTCVLSVLRQTLTSPIGIVALPANPSAKISDYIWVIRLPDVSRAVKLTFQSRFDIQDSPSCASSYLEVRDGDDSNSTLVGRYCGSTAPPVVTSSTNHFMDTMLFTKRNLARSAIDTRMLYEFFVGLFVAMRLL